MKMVTKKLKRYCVHPVWGYAQKHTELCCYDCIVSWSPKKKEEMKRRNHSASLSSSETRARTVKYEGITHNARHIFHSTTTKMALIHMQWKLVFDTLKTKNVGLH